MQDWVQQIFGNAVNPIAAYVIVFILIVLAIYILVRITRRLMGGAFISNSKSRHLRLAVMDATPVDAYRRLVLVRRDDVEHLILIGGPTDVVVEQNIKHSVQAQARQEPPPMLAPIPNTIAARSEPITPQVPIRQTQPTPQSHPIAQPAAPAPTAPRPLQPITPAPFRPVTPPVNINEARTLPSSTFTTARPALPIVPKIEAPIVATTVLAATATVEPAPKPTSPLSQDESVFNQLSKDIEKASNNKVDDISLEAEMEGLLASLDTKAGRIG
jgi:Flagellar biosynthesis protein, FliO